MVFAIITALQTASMLKDVTLVFSAIMKVKNAPASARKVQNAPANAKKLLKDQNVRLNAVRAPKDTNVQVSAKSQLKRRSAQVKVVRRKLDVLKRKAVKLHQAARIKSNFSHITTPLPE